MLSSLEIPFAQCAQWGILDSDANMQTDWRCTKSWCCRSEDLIYPQSLGRRWISSSNRHHKTRVTLLQGGNQALNAQPPCGGDGRWIVQSSSSLLNGPEAESSGMQLTLQRIPFVYCVCLFNHTTVGYIHIFSGLSCSAKPGYCCLESCRKSIPWETYVFQETSMAIGKYKHIKVVVSTESEYLTDPRKTCDPGLNGLL